MKSIRLRVFVVVALIAALPYVAPAPTMEQAPPANGKKSMQLQDIIDWKAVGATSLSKNGEWFAYRVAPQEGDAELIVKNVASGKELKFPLGERPAAGLASSSAVAPRSPTTRSGSRSTPTPCAPRRSGCVASAGRSRGRLSS